MATIKERFDSLGLSYSQAVLEQFGNHIKTVYNRVLISKKAQLEGGTWIWVNDYPESFTIQMDREILQYLKHRPNQRERFYITQWWQQRKFKNSITLNTQTL
jgi:transcriptional regulatory protein LevR